MKIATLWRLFAALAVGLWLAGAARAQQPFIYPSKGQSPKQEQTDKGQCYTWAVQQSHFDPLNPPAPIAPPPQAQPQSGSMGRSLIGGALLGAGIGALAGPHASEGAAIGGIFGALRYRHREQEEQQQQMQRQMAYQQQQSAIIAHGKANYERAFKACMVGRGYTVE